mgnify:CR=1 FL=1|tara:strand:+ start:73 stop:420 length:348 start_codon:yes stop_codon:yes gene_type:complete
MVFIVNIAFFLVVTAALIGYAVLPFTNLHLANASIASIKTKVNRVFAENRNQPDLIKSKLEESFAQQDAYKLDSITDVQENGFRIFELEFEYKALVQDSAEKLGKQKMRFIVNDV